MSAPAFISVSALAATTTTSLAITKPSSQFGDVLFAFVYCTNSTAIRTITPPAGWDEKTNQSYTNNPGGGNIYHRVVVYRKQDGGSEPASYTFTRTGDAGGEPFIGFITVYRPKDSLSSVDATVKTSVTASSTAPSLTALSDATLLCAFALYMPNAGSTTPPAGMTERIDSQRVGGAEAWELSDVGVTAGATGVKTATHTETCSAVGIALLIYDIDQPLATIVISPSVRQFTYIERPSTTIVLLGSAREITPQKPTTTIVIVLGPPGDSKLYTETPRGLWNGASDAPLGDEVLTALWNQKGAVKDRASYAIDKVQDQRSEVTLLDT